MRSSPATAWLPSIFFKVVPEESPWNENEPHPCFQVPISLNEPIVKHPKWADANCKLDPYTDPGPHRVRLEVQVKKHPQVQYVGDKNYRRPLYGSHVTASSGRIPRGRLPRRSQWLKLAVHVST